MFYKKINLWDNNFMQDIYNTFEFNEIKQSISEYSHSELGKEKILSLSMLKKDEVLS